MNKKFIFTFFNVVSYVFLLVCSFFINGKTAFSVAGAQPLITPAPYAFLIWIIIYLLFGIWIIRFGCKSTEYDVAYQKVSRFIPLVFCFAGGSLLVGQPIAVFCIIGSLLMTVFSYISCRHATSKSSFFRVPLSVYLSWISIASLIETLIVLKSRWGVELFGLSETFWTIFLLMFIGFIAITILSTQQDFIYPSVIIWASIGIAMNHLNHASIFITCCGVILLIGLMMDYMKRITEK